MPEQTSAPVDVSAAPTPDLHPGPPPVAEPGRPVPPQLRMGLLDYLAFSSLDADYAAAAQRREERPTEAEPGHGPRHAWTAVALGLFALLLTVAAVQSALGEPSVQESRDSLVEQARDGRATLDQARTDLADLQREVAALRVERRRAAAQSAALARRLTATGAEAGTVAVSGPGMTVTVDDAPGSDGEAGDKGVVYDRDLQRLANGLWEAGAEAVAINGQRLTSLSAIRLAGEAITVNFRSLRPPYVVQAIGDPDELPARFVDTAGGVWWLNLRAVYGLRFEMTSADELRLPAARPGTISFADVAEQRPAAQDEPRSAPPD